jgi:galactoside O-acetyltransferase
MMQSSFFKEEELRSIPFKHVGKNAFISRKCSIYSPEEISIGNNVRIDDFCILSGKISLGSHVHISAYSALYGKYGIILEDFTTISARVLVFSQNDDYTGGFLTNPMVPEHLRNVSGGTVIFKKFSIIGAGSIVMPGVTIQTGGAVGAMSLVTKDVEEWSIYVGIPAAFKKARKKKMADLSRDIE